MYSRVECCVFAVCVCLSSKSRVFLDGMIVISPMYVRMYVCTYFIYFYSISTYNKYMYIFYLLLV